MNCVGAHELLSRFHDGELDDELRQSVARHVRRCTRCESILGEFEAISELAGRSVTNELANELANGRINPEAELGNGWTPNSLPKA